MAPAKRKRKMANVSWSELTAALSNWCVWGFISLMVASQFVGILWNTTEFEEDAFYGRSPVNPLSPIPGTNDEPYTDRNVVCMAQGRSYVPMQLSQVLADPKLSHVVDSTGTSVNGYRVVARDQVSLDESTAKDWVKICDRIDYTLQAIQDSCDKMGYNVTRDKLRIVGDILSTTTKEIPRALPILIMPFWDNGIYAHYAIPGWDGQACVFRLDGMYVDPALPSGVLRATPRVVRETNTAEWLGKRAGAWRNGWYEDASGEQWSVDMMTTDNTNPYGLRSRQFDTIANAEMDCTTRPLAQSCKDYPRIDRWGRNCLNTQANSWFHQAYISNGTHFGQFMYTARHKRTIQNKYSLETFISNVSIFTLLFRWFVSMAAMLNSYRRGLAPWQTTGIGCLSSSRAFCLLPIVLLPRLKMTMAAFWTIGCHTEGQQRALSDAWFTVYPSIVELMLLYFSILNFVSKVTHYRVSDSLFGPSVLAFSLLHRLRFVLVDWPPMGLGGRIAPVVTSDQFEEFQLLDLFTPSVALRMNLNIRAIFHIKLVLLAVNLVPLFFAENMTRLGKKYRSCGVCELEKTLVLRASNVGGLGLSEIYLFDEKDKSDTDKKSPTPAGRRDTRGPFAEDAHLMVPARRPQVLPYATTMVRTFRNIVAGRDDSPPPPIRSHVVIGYEVGRLGYIVYGSKFLITFDDWYILTSMAPLRVVEKLWNHRITVYDVTKKKNGYAVSSHSRLCRLDDKDLRRIPFYDVTICAFR